MPDTLRQKIIKDIGGTIYTKLIVDGKQVKPTSATVTIKTQGNADLTTPVSGAACTVDNFGKITYAVTAGNADQQADLYKASFTIVYNTTNYYRDIFYDVTLIDTFIFITEDDVKNKLPKLKDRDLGNIEYNNIIVDTFKFELMNDIKNKGLYSHSMVRPEDFAIAHIYKVLSNICNNQSNDVGDYWEGQRDYWEAKYNKELSSGIFAYDNDEDGYLTEAENMASSNAIRMIR